VALWFITVPASMLAGAGGRHVADPAAPAASYVDVFRDRRFWAMLGMVVAVNITWHTYRTWLPKYLQDVRHFTEVDMTGLTTAYYLLADVGSWTVGLLTLVLMRRYGLTGHNARLLVYLGCGGLVLVSVVVPFAPAGFALTGLVLIYAFAALGLFPTYFAMSQDLSVAHQGKVTGTLGAGAHLTLSLVVYPIQGWVIQETKSYDWVLGVAGIFPLLGFALMVFLWPPERPAAADVAPG
jgi:ACS family hexuronate transporter-like MFS transporter